MWQLTFTQTSVYYYPTTAGFDNCTQFQTQVRAGKPSRLTSQLSPHCSSSEGTAGCRWDVQPFQLIAALCAHKLERNIPDVSHEFHTKFEYRLSEQMVLLQVQTLKNTVTGSDIVVNNYTSVRLNSESQSQLEVFNGNTHIGYVFLLLQGGPVLHNAIICRIVHGQISVSTPCLLDCKSACKVALQCSSWA